MHEEMAHSQGKDVDIIKVWETLDDGSFSGRNWLVKLAIRILSVVANSAGCERLFSQMGRIHTKYRARLNLQRVRNTVVLKSALMRQFEESSETKHRKLKRKIRDYEEEEPEVGEPPNNSILQDSNTCNGLNESNAASTAEPPDEIETHNYDFTEAEVEVVLRGDSEGLLRTMANKLVNDTLMDDTTTAEINQYIRNAANPAPLIRSALFGRPERTPLSSLFNFSNPNHSVPPAPPGTAHSSALKPKSFDMYWRGAIKSLECRLDELKLSQGLVSVQKPCSNAPAGEE
ncbi:unnamed protein product [Rhizoctonia solani]|uniref:HAT C-terminal dimerisation domain-containing protein n=1 Tax=Rhizoctonia solani TaxID=456999 RepID=A0A8H3GRX0_9AGAM|nr:unnamed protein product [Rhizoctonia solani]